MNKKVLLSLDLNIIKQLDEKDVNKSKLVNRLLTEYTQKLERNTNNEELNQMLKKAQIQQTMQLPQLKETIDLIQERFGLTRYQIIRKLEQGI